MPRSGTTCFFWSFLFPEYDKLAWHLVEVGALPGAQHEPEEVTEKNDLVELTPHLWVLHRVSSPASWQRAGESEK